ncbi:hypothetical protein QUC31_017881 [Theobroma cacao]
MCSEDFTKLRQKVSLVTRGGFGADEKEKPMRERVRKKSGSQNNSSTALFNPSIDSFLPLNSHGRDSGEKRCCSRRGGKDW